MTLFVIGDETESSTRLFIRRHSFTLSTTVNSFIMNPLMVNIGHEDLTSGLPRPQARFDARTEADVITSPQESTMMYGASTGKAVNQMTRNIAEAIILDENDDLRFENFCRDLCQRLDGIVLLPTSRPRGTPQNRPVGVTSKPAS
jgi:hypothetical protein